MKVKKFSFGSVSGKMSDKMLKATLGGYGTGCGDYVEWAPGSCGWGLKEFDGPFGPGGSKACGVSRAFAVYYQCMYGGNWCCDSCSTTWYCPGT